MVASTFIILHDLDSGLEQIIPVKKIVRIFEHQVGQRRPVVLWIEGVCTTPLEVRESIADIRRMLDECGSRVVS